MGAGEIIQNLPLAGAGRTETFRFHDDAVFPEELSLQSSGGPGWRTYVHDKRDGEHPRMSAMPPAGRRRYAIEIEGQSREFVNELVNFAFNREGSLYGFLFKDRRDFTLHNDGKTTTSNPADRRLIACGDGVTTKFRLWKQYVDASGEVVARAITRPIPGTVFLWLDGIGQTENTHFSVDHDTGEITFAAAPDPGAYIEGVAQFRVPVRFGEEVDQWLQAQQLGHDNQNVAALPMEELLAQDYQAYPFRFGGHRAWSFTTLAAMLSLSDGIYQEVDATGSALGILFLPVVVNIGARGPIVYVKNTSGSVTLTLFSVGNVLVGTIGPGVMGEISWTGSGFNLIV